MIRNIIRMEIGRRKEMTDVGKSGGPVKSFFLVQISRRRKKRMGNDEIAIGKEFALDRVFFQVKIPKVLFRSNLIERILYFLIQIIEIPVIEWNQFIFDVKVRFKAKF